MNPINITLLSGSDILLYVLAVNAIAFTAYGLDKTLAKRGAKRISERILLLLALIGGIAGAMIGQRFWRHKTQKRTFKRSLYAIAVLQIVLGIGLLISALKHS